MAYLSEAAVEQVVLELSSALDTRSLPTPILALMEGCPSGRPMPMWCWPNA
jgi:hypothetical protein